MKNPHVYFMYNLDALGDDRLRAVDRLICHSSHLNVDDLLPLVILLKYGVALIGAEKERTQPEHCP